MFTLRESHSTWAAEKISDDKQKVWSFIALKLTIKLAIVSTSKPSVGTAAPMRYSKDSAWELKIFKQFDSKWSALQRKRASVCTDNLAKV